MKLTIKSTIEISLHSVIETLSKNSHFLFCLHISGWMVTPTGDWDWAATSFAQWFKILNSPSFHHSGSKPKICPNFTKINQISEFYPTRPTVIKWGKIPDFEPLCIVPRTNRQIFNFSIISSIFWQNGSKMDETQIGINLPSNCQRIFDRFSPENN